MSIVRITRAEHRATDRTREELDKGNIVHVLNEEGDVVIIAGSEPRDPAKVCEWCECPCHDE